MSQAKYTEPKATNPSSTTDRQKNTEARESVSQQKIRNDSKLIALDTQELAGICELNGVCH
ncbi:hypothetical protein NST83_20570 [Paenibacillus sp. FSL R10-2782]|uniref:hypothetical protein n=1 Tax=Paenibacillus sp. FSL R10-2782 TaxID=2954661 RepID=UPI003159505C